MPKKLHYNTVSPLLRDILSQLMELPEFAPFCLVGGTSLSLQLGHRISIDIDLFTETPYGTLDFHAIQNKLRSMYPYCQGDCGEIVGMGASYIVGNSAYDSIKLDLFYTDPFIRPIKTIDNIRIASVEDIVAMKLDVIGRNGRKKDFWDLHELHDKYTIEEMLDFYAERYPYGHTREELLQGLTNFSLADTEPDPNCLRSKAWPLIKLDFMEWSR